MHDAHHPPRHIFPWLLAAILAQPLLLSPTLAIAQQPTTPAHTDATDPSKTRLSLRILPPHATVTLDGRPVDASTELYLAPGTHTIEVRAEGYITRQETLNLEALAAREILMSINLSRQPEPASPSLHHDGLVDQMGSGRPITGWIMTASGAALLTTSIVLAIRQANVLSECRDRGRCESETAATGWTTLAGSLGGASLIGGITLLSWSALAGEPQPTTTASSPQTRDRVRGISLAITF